MGVKSSPCPCSDSVPPLVQSYVVDSQETPSACLTAPALAPLRDRALRTILSRQEMRILTLGGLDDDALARLRDARAELVRTAASFAPETAAADTDGAFLDLTSYCRWYLIRPVASVVPRPSPPTLRWR